MKDWEKYIEYLKNWAEEHKGDEFEGMSPAGYNEWQNNENEHDGDDRIIAQITWTVEDIKNSLKDELGREPTEQEVEDCLEFFESESCEDQSTSYGWEFVNSAVENYVNSLDDEEDEDDDSDN